MIIRAIYDDCTPTRDRRPTTREDIENDIHVEEFNSIPELIDTWEGDYTDVAEDFEIDPANETDVLNAVLDTYNDPGDGSINVLYLSIDGVPYQHDSVMPYDGMEKLNLEHATEDEIKDQQIKWYEDEYGFDEDDDYEDDEESDSEEDEDLYV